MKAMLTGGGGFIGTHLAAHLRESGDHAAVDATDILDAAGQRAAVDRNHPDVVFHLAGISSSAAAARDPVRAFEVNALGAVRIIEAVRDAAPRARVVLFTSSEVYPPSSAPLCESAPVNPAGTYGITKAAAHHLGRTLGAAWGIDIVEVRPFYNVGPGQAAGFVLPDWCSQLARGADCIRVGNLDVERDFLDVRDAVRAYRLLAMKGERGAAYNVCRGQARSLRGVLDALIAISGRRVAIDVDPSLMRPGIVARVEGCGHKLREATGWAPAVDWDATLRDCYSLAAATCG